MSSKKVWSWATRYPATDPPPVECSFTVDNGAIFEVGPARFQNALVVSCNGKVVVHETDDGVILVAFKGPLKTP